MTGWKLWRAIAIGMLSRETRDDAMFAGMLALPKWMRRARAYKYAARRLMEHWHPDLKKRR